MQEVQKWSITDQYLTIGMVLKEGGAIRFASARIPVGDLFQDREFRLVYERHLALQLKRFWEMTLDDSEPLF